MLITCRRDHALHQSLAFRGYPVDRSIRPKQQTDKHAEKGSVERTFIFLCLHVLHPVLVLRWVFRADIFRTAALLGVGGDGSMIGGQQLYCGTVCSAQFAVGAVVSSCGGFDELRALTSCRQLASI